MTVEKPGQLVARRLLAQCVADPPGWPAPARSARWRCAASATPAPDRSWPACECWTCSTPSSSPCDASGRHAYARGASEKWRQLRFCDEPAEPARNARTLRHGHVLAARAGRGPHRCRCGQLH
jgi:hypothetical protein